MPDDGPNSSAHTGDSEPPRLTVTFDPSRSHDFLTERVIASAMAEPSAGRQPMTVEDFRAAAEREGVLQGVVQSLDLEDLGLQVRLEREAVADLFQERMDSVTRVFRTLEFLGRDLGDLVPIVPPSFPPTLGGRLVNPDGRDAAYVSVAALEPGFGGDLEQRLPWPNPETRTDARGAFSLNLPAMPIPESGMVLSVRGANRTVEVPLRRIDLIGGGNLGAVPLDREVTPLPRSIIAQLGDVLLPTTAEDPLEHPEDFAAPARPITLGEGDCARSFRSNAGVIDRFSYAMLVRLVAPQLSAKRLANDVRGDRGRFRMSAASATLQRYAETGQLLEILGQLGQWTVVDRGPIEAPIDVERFLHQVQTNPLAVPKAATLALGYTVRMHQLWLPQGLSLGDLVYSLPLAPGEQQRIAVSEERETLSVRDIESLSESEQQSFRENADTSTQAVFSSAFEESAAGGSEMKVRSRSGSIGGGLGVGGFFGKIVAGLGIAGGYSDSTTTGSTSSWQNASRDYVSNASQAFHSALARQASARRSASRTSVRLATATETREVVTKVITNHNHNHALTMQYWQVLRHYGVTSSVDDVQLVCFVPLELVRWLTPGMPRLLPTGSYGRDLLLLRYQALMRYHDVLEPLVVGRPELRHGLRVLRTFAGDPTMTVQSSAGAAQDVISVGINGTFLPFEDVYAIAVTQTGGRVGPIRLSNNSQAVPAGHETRAALVQDLRNRRNGGAFDNRNGSLTLPGSVPASSIARFEFSRTWRPFSYKLSLPGGLNIGDLPSWLGLSFRLDVNLSAGELESEIGSPVVEDPVATLNGESVIEPYNTPGGTDRMPVNLPVSAKRIPPKLAFADLLRIEALLQHVVENSVTFSRAVWQGLTPEERAIMLEPYTIGVPTGGLSDEADEVPLLNCVANEVLGFFGNAALMPFFIPEPLAREVEFTSRDIQEALLAFHRQAYRPAQTTITLPARGVLGEAVLGACNSSEKIDLTRFWNWQDSPADEATDLASVITALGSGNQLVGPAGAQAPANLQTGSMITLNQGAPGLTPPEVLASLIGSAPESNLPRDLTGITQLGAQAKVQAETTAETLNKTISEATGLAKNAMENIPEVIKAKAEAKKAGEKDKEGEKKEEKKDDGAVDGGKAPTT